MTAAGRRKREREDALFRQLTLAEGLVPEEQMRAAVRERARRHSRGYDLSLYQVLLKLELLSFEDVKRILGRLHEAYAFCDACGQEAPQAEGTTPVCPACGRDVDPGRTRAVAPPDGARRPSRRSASQRIAADALVGGLIGKCRLEEKVGAGGMGTVYRARHLGLDKVVAVKVLSVGSGDPGDRVKRFIREARTMARIRHPNVLTIHDVHAEDRLYAIVMEYCEGLDLGRIVSAGGALPVRQAIDHAVQACRGLSALHAAGILHRDMKPDNLMIDADGVVRVMDFSLAREIEGSRDLTLSDEILGTPYYMSPEQCTGRPLDPRSDLYSLGATLYQLLTGQRPFGGDSAVSVIMKHLFEEPIPPHRLNRTIPARVGRVVLKLLSKNPDLRYADCAALEQDLLRVGRGQSPLSVSFLSEGARRRLVRAGWASAAAALLALGAGGAWLAGRAGTSGAAVPEVGRADPPPEPPRLDERWANERTAQGRLDALVSVAESEPIETYPKWIAKFGELLREFPETTAAAGAGAHVARMRGRLKGAAIAWWKAAEPDLADALARDRFDAGRQVLDGIPVHFRSQLVEIENVGRRRVDQAEREFREARDAAIARVRERVAELEAKGDLAGAVLAVDDLPPRFAGLAEAKDLVPAREALEGRARKAWDELAPRFEAALAAGDVDSAGDLLGRLARVSVGGLEVERLAMVSRRDQVERDRREAAVADRLDTDLAVVRTHLLVWKFDEARRRIEAARTNPANAGLAGRIDRVAREVEAFERVVDAARVELGRMQERRATARISLQAGRAEPIVGRVTKVQPESFELEESRSIESGDVTRRRTVELRDLAPESLVELAGATGAFDRAVFLLRNGRFEPADELLDAVPAGGPDVALYVAEIDEEWFKRKLDAFSKARDENRSADAWRLLGELDGLRPGDPRTRSNREAFLASIEGRCVVFGPRLLHRVTTGLSRGRGSWETEGQALALEDPLGGGLTVRNGAPDGKVLYARLKDADAGDVGLDVVLVPRELPRDWCAGVFFRGELRQGYVFAIGEGGWILSSTPDPGSTGPSIRGEVLAQGRIDPAPGRPIELVVLAVGDEVLLRVDGIDAATVRHSAHRAGGVGLFATGGVTLDVPTFRVDDLVPEEEK